MYDLPLESFIHSKGHSFYVEQSLKISDTVINSDRYYCGTLLSFNNFFFEDVKRIVREIGACDDIICLLDSLCESKTINEFYVGAAKREENIFNRLYFGYTDLKNKSDNYQRHGGGCGFEWSIENPHKYFLKNYDVIDVNDLYGVLGVVEDITRSKSISRLLKTIFCRNGNSSVTNVLSCDCDFLDRKSIDFQICDKVNLPSLAPYIKDISKIFNVPAEKIMREISQDSKINRVQVSYSGDNKVSLNVYFGGRFVYTSRNRNQHPREIY